MKQKWSNYGRCRHPIQWYQMALNEYLRVNNPKKLKFNPTVIEVNEKHVVFGMEKHYGRLLIETEIIDDFYKEELKTKKK